jgi:hypothetical protein
MGDRQAAGQTLNPHRHIPPAVITARQMPLLHHYHQGRPFSIMESDAVDWLISQPEVRQHIWNVAKRDGSVVLDPESGQWHGVDWRP